MPDYETIANLCAQDAAEQRLDQLHDAFARLMSKAELEADDFTVIFNALREDIGCATDEQLHALVDEVSFVDCTPNAFDSADLATLCYALSFNLRQANDANAIAKDAAVNLAEVAAECAKTLYDLRFHMETPRSRKATKPWHAAVRVLDRAAEARLIPRKPFRYDGSKW